MKFVKISEQAEGVLFVEKGYMCKIVMKWDFCDIFVATILMQFCCKVKIKHY